MDAADRDLATLFDHLGRLVGSADGGRPEALPYLATEYLADLRGFASRFFQRWFDHAPEGCTLVFDDHHEVTGGPIDALLEGALAAIPPGMRLVVVSRTEVPLQLMRSLASGDLVRLGWDALRLDADETVAVLERLAPHLAERSGEIHKRSGGWAAGVVLMSTCADLRTTDPGASPDASRAAFAYFAAEVLMRMPESDRELLLRTSVFSQFTATMAERISDHACPAKVLDALYREHYFTERQAGSCPQYRYHDLFREFLRSRLRECLSEDEWNLLLIQAGGLLRECGDVEGAAAAWLEAQDWKALADLATNEARAMLAKGRWQTLLGWLAAIPGEHVDGNPWLLYWRGAALTSTDPQSGRQQLEQAFRTFHLRNEQAAELLCCGAIMETYFQQWNTIAPLDEWIHEAERLLDSGDTLDDAIRTDVVVTLARAVLFRCPSHPRLRGWIEDVAAALSKERDPNRQLVAATLLFDYDSNYDNVKRFRSTVERTEQLARSEMCMPIQCAIWWERAASFLYRRGDYQEATRAYNEALRVARTHGLADQEHLVLLGLAMTALSKENISEGSELVEELRTVLNSERRMHLASFYYADLWLAIVKEDRQRADDVLKAFAALPLVGAPILAIFNHPLVWVLVAKGAHAAALERIGRWREGLAGMHSPVVNFNLDCMEAYVRLSSEDRESAREPLSRAFAAGARCRYRTMYTWLPAMMATLCQAACEWRIEPAYTRWLVEERALRPPRPETQHWPRRVEIRVLGPLALSLRGEPIRFGRKAPRRVLAVLKTIIAHGTAGATTEAVCEEVWPDLEGDAADDALATSLVRLRRLLGGHTAVVLKNGRINLDSETVWVDAYALEALQPSVPADIVLDLYRGPFLPGEDGGSTVLAARDRLRQHFTRLVEAGGRTLESSGSWDEAAALYQQGVSADPLLESLYQGAMRCHSAAGRPAEAAAVFRRLRQTLSITLGTRPSKASLELAQSLGDPI